MTAELEKFIRRLAKLETPTDPKRIKAYRKENGYGVDGFDDVGYENIEEEIIADLPGDDAHEDACEFYNLIREARDLVAKLDTSKG